MAMSRSWALDPPQRIRPRPRPAASRRAPSLFARLVAEADAVFANFKPGTLASLGFSYERLREINPAHRACRKQRVRGDRAVERHGWATARWCVRRQASRGCGPRRTPNRAASMTPPRSFPIMSSAGITAMAALARGAFGDTHRNRCARPYLAGRSRRQPTRDRLRRRGRRTAGLPVADDTAVHARLPVCRRRRMVRHLACGPRPTVPLSPRSSVARTSTERALRSRPCPNGRPHSDKPMSPRVCSAQACPPRR